MKSKKVSIIIFGIMLFLIIVMCGLVYMSIYEGFGFTSAQAAGDFADNECISTKDFDVYYYNIREGVEPAICGFSMVEKLPIGYKTVYDKEYRKIYIEDEYLGILYSVKGDSGYCNVLILNYATNKQIPEDILVIKNVEVDGKKIDVKVNSLFETEEVPSEIIVGGCTMTVDKEVHNE